QQSNIVSQQWCLAIMAGPDVSKEPTLCAQCLGSYSPPSSRYALFPSTEEGHSDGDPAAQEELFVDDEGRSAVWRSLGGQVAYKSFRSAGQGQGEWDDEVVQVVRCRFRPLKDGQGFQRVREKSDHEELAWPKAPWVFCTLRSPDLVTAYYSDGQVYEITLPFHARLLQPLAEGLLVQRFRIAGVGSEGVVGNGEEDEESFEPVPSLFSLLHPLDEVRPVALLDQSTGAQNAGAMRDSLSSAATRRDEDLELVCDASELVLYCRGGENRSEPSLLVTYHSGHRRHAVWQVLPAPEVERAPEQEPVKGQGQGHRHRVDPEADTDPTMLWSPDAASRSAAGSPFLWGPSAQDSRAAGAVPTPVSSMSMLGPGVGGSSTLLGSSNLDSSMAVAGLSVVDEVLAQRHQSRSHAG
ncbi:unnamed protein product, partial [Discosporangium mesarthrocarpum]